jgi:hypothetical protein
MYHQVEPDSKHRMCEIESHIKEWIQKISKSRQELGGSPICPFALKATYTIVECSAKDIEIIPGYDVVFYVIEDYIDDKLDDIVESKIEYLEKIHPEYKFVPDYNDDERYVKHFRVDNGKYNFVMMMNRKQMYDARKILFNNGYYEKCDFECADAHLFKN